MVQSSGKSRGFKINHNIDALIKCIVMSIDEDSLICALLQNLRGGCRQRIAISGTLLVPVCLGGTNPSIVTRKTTYATATFLSFDGSTIDVFVVAGRHLCDENGGVEPTQ